MTGGFLVLLAATVAVAAFVQGASGLGFALIVAPVVGMAAPELLPGFLLAVMVPLNLYIAWREREALDLRGASWITIARLATTPAGVLLLAAVSERSLEFLVGLSMVLAALVSLAAPVFVPGRRTFLAAGAVTGVTETATGIGGPPLALAYQHRPPAEMRATICACFLVGQVVSLAVLGAAGQVHAEQFRSAALVLPALAAGVWLSRLLHHRVDASRLRFIVLAFAVVSGGVLMLGL